MRKSGQRSCKPSTVTVVKTLAEKPKEVVLQSAVCCPVCMHCALEFVVKSLDGKAIVFGSAPALGQVPPPGLSSACAVCC